MAELHCTQCQAGPLEEGFVEDGGQSSYGYSRWIPGPLKRGVFGGAKRAGKQRWVITALRCPACGHLELFATGPT
ncbi:hypothetical protein KSP35_06785 [Aquihabitans sp. G128]|uniref:hypothetical protein n=1 Tax=Aquihabitans sp. G128 TaxID=2849779 RepID=UPI001C24CF51|nr:hypothetical protein [Aquihabitans sp. G128]QXC62501.1 hypothetical protein KSP35_06785 [Aquihabitans sp. G128]